MKTTVLALQLPTVIWVLTRKDYMGSNQERLYGVWKILCEVLIVEINKNFVNHKKKDLRMFTLT